MTRSLDPSKADWDMRSETFAMVRSPSGQCGGHILWPLVIRRFGGAAQFLHVGVRYSSAARTSLPRLIVERWYGRREIYEPFR